MCWKHRFAKIDAAFEHPIPILNKLLRRLLNLKIKLKVKNGAHLTFFPLFLDTDYPTVKTARLQLFLKSDGWRAR